METRLSDIALEMRNNTMVLRLPRTFALVCMHYLKWIKFHTLPPLNWNFTNSSHSNLPVRWWRIKQANFDCLIIMLQSGSNWDRMGLQYLPRWSRNHPKSFSVDQQIIYDLISLNSMKVGNFEMNCREQDAFGLLNWIYKINIHLS